ncbi:hypothetical protein HD600_002363 [Microbacterium ginsengiterrae]|uniref:Uncharacterized protein n=1 Tax=Microbacterium ginsengiterrae TaxID=546115 RepID=A0A7W9CEA5_9MICO|nr:MULTISPECIES: hypothetical protein [Microbacterium]MBB5743866.1 hypothetical protein [Microbacterium ginsengiterrae]
MTSRQLRLLRGAAASSVATIIAAVSHTVGGGASPHPLLIVAVSVFLAPLAAVMVGRRPSLPRLSATVVVSQVIFHALFVALNATVTPTVGSSTHDHSGVVLPVDVATAAIVTDGGMTTAHVVAAVLTIALLHRGESVLVAIARGVHAVLRRGLPVAAPASWPAPAAFAGTARTAVDIIRIADASRRGPPVLFRG